MSRRIKNHRSAHRPAARQHKRPWECTLAVLSRSLESYWSLHDRTTNSGLSVCLLGHFLLLARPSPEQVSSPQYTCCKYADADVLRCFDFRTVTIVFSLAYIDSCNNCYRCTDGNEQPM